MADAFVVDAVRTPRGIGRVGKGGLAHLHPQQVSAAVLKAIVERNRIDSRTVQDVVWSTSAQKGKQRRMSVGCPP
jgi:acetyl-CoA C-acetyltransferase